MQSQQAKRFCQGCLYQLHLFFLHPKPLAQGLQCLMSRALTPLGSSRASGPEAPRGLGRERRA